MTDDEIQEFINSRNVTQDTYVAPTVKTHVVDTRSAPAMVQVAQTVKPKEPTLKEAVKQYGDTLKNSRVKNEGLSWDNAVTDLANIYDARKNVAKSIPVIGNLFKAADTAGSTVVNTATNMGTGALKSLEGAADTASDLVFNPIEQRYNYAYDFLTKGKKTADENLADLKKMQQRDIKKNMTQDFEDKVGYTDIADDLEKNSLVKRDNLAGQVAQGTGGMVPALVLGQAFGGTPQLNNLSGLAGKEKLAAALGNVGKTYMAQLPSNLMLGAQSYGGGMEEALNEGASMNQARAYGLTDALIEQGTEMLTGGVPGLEGRGGLDQLVDPLINRNTNGYLNALLRAGYGAFGEGLEEYASEMLSPLARKIYSDEDIDWNQVRKNARQAGLTGAITGSILNAPSNIQDISNVRTENRIRNAIGDAEYAEGNQQYNPDYKGWENQREENRINNEQRLEENTKRREEVERARQEAARQQETAQETQKEQTNVIEREAPKTSQTASNELNTDIKSFADVKQDYKLYKNADLENFDSTMLDKAKDTIIANRDGKRTKQEWLDVAKNMGMQAQNLDNQALKKLAFESFAYEQPNQKGNLNRQGNKHVPFGIHEWVKAVYEGAGVGTRPAVRSEKYSNLRNELDALSEKEIVSKNLTKEEQQEILDRIYDENLDETELSNRLNEEIFNQTTKNFNSRIMEREARETKLPKEEFVKKWNTPQGKELGFTKQDIERVYDEAKGNTLSDQLERQGTKILENAERDRQGMIDIFESYLEENGITNPTQEDINNSLDAYDLMDANDEGVPISQLEAKYDKTIKEYLKEKNVNLAAEKESDPVIKVEPEKKTKVKQEAKVEENASNEIQDADMQDNFDDALYEGREVKVLDEVPKQPKKSLKERTRDTVKRLTRDFISKGESVERLARKEKNPNLNHMYDRLGITRGEAQEHIGSMQRDLDLKPRKNFTGADGKKTTMSLNGIREDARTHNIPESTLNQYLAEYRNVDTVKQGKPILNKSAETSMKVIEEIEAQHPEIKRIAENVWTFERNQLQDRVDSGLINENFAKDLMENNPHYVRIQRNVQGKRTTNTLNDTKRGVEVNRQIDTLKGSDADVMPIMESIAKYTEQVQQSMRMNQFGQELAETLGVGSQDDSISSFTDEESFGVNPDLLQDDGNGNYTLTVFKNGVATVVPIDQGLYEALTPNKTVQALENNETFKKLTYPPKKMSEMFRTLTTDKNPVFMFTNAFRDIGDAPFNSKYTGEFLKTYASTEALRQVAGNGVYNQLYEAAGGRQNSYFNNGEFVDKTQTKAQKLKDKLLMPIEKGNEIVESVPRMAEFIATIKANGYEVNADGELVVKNKNKATRSANEVLNEALYNAAEVTTNFKRGGDVAKMLNRNGATFLNASIQGFDKQVRNFTQINNPRQAVMLLTKALIFGIAPTMLNDAMWDDDDEYEEMQEYQKDNYYLFKGKNGQWIRIPKGRAMSVIGGAFRRGKNYLQGDKDAFKGFGKFAADQVAPNSVVSNNIFAPLSQVKNNESWSGNKIISDSMAKRPTDEQYNEKTDEVSKFIGKAIKDLPLPESMKNFKSPLAIHYLLDQYTGAIGDVFLPMITEKSSSKYNPLIAPFISKFTADSVYSNRSVSDYYDRKTEIETQKNSEKATPLDVAKNSYMTSRNYDISNLYKEQREIQNNKSLSKEEKYDQAREKQKEINKTAKKIIKDIDNLEENEYYLKIGDYYYKKVIEDGEEKYKRDTSKKIPTDDKYALYDYFKEKYEKSKEESEG